MIVATDRVISITPWEQIPGITQKEVLNHLDGDQLEEYVQSEKRMMRARAEARANEFQFIENQQPREEFIISAAEVAEALRDAAAPPVEVQTFTHKAQTSFFFGHPERVKK